MSCDELAELIDDEKLIARPRGPVQQNQDSQSVSIVNFECLTSPQVASVHARPEDDALFQAQLLDHIMLHSGSCGGRERHQRHLGIPVRQKRYCLCPVSFLSVMLNPK